MSIFLHGCWRCIRATVSELLVKNTGLVVAVVLAMANVGVSHADDATQTSQGRDQTSLKVNERFLTNTVRSTSLETPGTARVIPLEETKAFEGTILDADGQPAQDAEVWGISLNALPPVRELARTDANGHFKLHLLPKTNWSIRAFKGNATANVTGETPLDPSQITELPDARLSAQCDVNCTITDRSSDQAISGARVYLDDGRVVVSDAEGDVDMSGLTPGTHDAIVLARGFEIKQVSFYSLSENENHLTLRLYPANTISGKIINEVDTPMPNAWLTRNTKILNSLAADGTYLLTDENGQFAGPGNPAVSGGRMNDLLQGELEIDRVGAKDYVSKSIQAIVAANNTGNPLTITLREQPTSVREPTVLKIGGGTLFNGSPINDQPSEEELSGINLAPRTRAQVMLEANLIIPELPAEMRSLRSFADPEPRIERRVVDQKGLALAGVRIEPADLFDIMGAGRISSLFEEKESISFTDKLGVFSFSSNMMSNDTLVLTHEDYAKKVIDKSSLIDKADDIQMEPRRFVRARVVDESSKPITAFQVIVKPIHPAVMVDVNLPTESFEPITLESVSNDGTFAYHDQWRNSGLFAITIKADGMIDHAGEVYIDPNQREQPEFVMKKAVSLNVNVSPAVATSGGATISNITLATLPRVEIANKSDPLFGRIRCVEYGASIREVERQSKIDVTQPRGDFAIEAPGFARQFFSWNSDTPDYDVKLVPESTIAVSIQSEFNNKSPITLSLACVYDRYSSRTRVDKELLIPSLSAGWYRLQFTQDNQPLITSNVFIKTGERLDLNYKIDDSGLMELVEQKSSENLLPDDVQFIVNGVPGRHGSIDEYLADINRQIAEKSETATPITKEFLLELLRKRIDQIKGNPVELQYQGGQIEVIKSLMQDEKWPVGIECTYIDPKADHTENASLVICVPTPESEMIDQKLIIGF